MRLARSAVTPVRVDIDIHVHELVAVPALLRAPAPPLPCPLLMRGRRGRGGRRRLRRTTRRRLLRLGLRHSSRASDTVGPPTDIGRRKTRAGRGWRWCRSAAAPGNGARRGRGSSARGRAMGRPQRPQRRSGAVATTGNTGGGHRHGCRSSGRRLRQWQPARPARQRRHAAGASAALARGASSTGFVDRKIRNFLDVERKVEQLPAEEVLKSRHRILHQVCAELLDVLKEFERIEQPNRSARLGRHRSRRWLR